MIGAFLVSFLYYRKQRNTKDWSKLKVSALIALRGLGLSLLGVLLLGIILESSEMKKGKPVVITLVDSSTSMLVHSDSLSVSKDVTDYLKSLQKKFKDQMDILIYSVGDEEKNYDAKFDGEETDLYSGFDFIFNQYYGRDQKVICLISDGNFNKGVNPVYAAEKISLTPIYTLGVGDTIIKKDHFIRSAIANEVAFLKNQFPLTVNIEARKIQAGKSFVRLLKEGKEIARQEINYNNEPLQYFEHTFLVDADQLGFMAYEVQIEEIADEVSYVNNSTTVYIEVLDNRSKILLLADAPHPDITAVKKAIESKENLLVDAGLISDFDKDINEYELVILHISKNVNHAEILNKIKASNAGVFYMIGSSVNAAEVSKMGLSIKYPNGTSKDEVRVYENTSFQTFEISDKLKSELLNWPPLSVKFGSIDEGSGTVLLRQRVGTVKKDDPVLFFKEGDRKIGVLLGDGIWRWNLMEFAKNGNHEAFNELINKSVQFLTVKDNKEPFRVTMPKRFRSNEEVLIKAEFYNKSMQPITSPDVSFVLKGEEVEEINYTFAKSDKAYSLNLGELKPGRYEWEAKASFEGKTYKKTGTFVVEFISLEQLETVANHALLRTLSQQSGGQFFALKNYEQMLAHLANRKDLAPKSYQEKEYSDLIDHLWLFLCIIFVFSLEWFIRRYSGSY